MHKIDTNEQPGTKMLIRFLVYGIQIEDPDLLSSS